MVFSGYVVFAKTVESFGSEKQLKIFIFQYFLTCWSHLSKRTSNYRPWLVTFKTVAALLKYCTAMTRETMK